MPTFDNDYPTCEKTFATLRIYHKDEDPEAVTRALGILPSEFQIKGMNVVNGREVPRRISGWFLSSEGQIESRDVRRHIVWILDQIRELDREFESLQRDGWNAGVNCFWLGIGQGGPMLDPEQMRDLAKLNLNCGFDVYQNGDSHQSMDAKPG